MKYKTKDGQDYTLPGIGRTTNGLIVTNRSIENSNFELIEDQPVPATPAPPATVVQPTTPDPTPLPAAPQANEQKEMN